MTYSFLPPAAQVLIPAAVGLLICCSALAAGNRPAPPAVSPPRVFLLDPDQLQVARQRLREGDKTLKPALDQLEREAQRTLKIRPLTVMQKRTLPPSGDKHDYLSLAPYFWPNPATSNGLPYTRRDGQRYPGAYEDTDRKALGDMADQVETLALAHYFTGSEPYAEHAARLIRAWFLDSATRMNPNFEFAQAVRGVNTGRGIGLIEARAFTHVADAAGLLAGSKSWAAADERALRKWFEAFLKWMRESRLGRDEAAAKNNHGTFYDLQVAVYALYVDKPETAREVLRSVGPHRVSSQVEPDGRQPLELERTKAWSYSIANLSGLMTLADLAGRCGVDLWHYETPDGRSICRALDYLVPFSLGGKAWPFEQIGGFSPEALYPLLREAARCRPEREYISLLAKIPPEDESARTRLLRPSPPGH